MSPSRLGTTEYLQMAIFYFHTKQASTTRDAWDVTLYTSSMLLSEYTMVGKLSVRLY